MLNATSRFEIEYRFELRVKFHEWHSYVKIESDTVVEIDEIDKILEDASHFEI